MNLGLQGTVAALTGAQQRDRPGDHEDLRRGVTGANCVIDGGLIKTT